MGKIQKPNLDDCVETLAAFVAAVQHKEAYGRMPQFPNGQTFEQWVGNKAAKALGFRDLQEFSEA